ncbi:MAG: YbaK/EbsC family protein [Isosphaeraceae bacterium]
MCIRDWLQSRDVWFERFLHCPAPTASRMASSVHVSGRRVAKGVLVRHELGYALAVLPATARVDLDRLGVILGNGPVRLATEAEVARVFVDCELGALPPFGRLYGLTTIVDEGLGRSGEVIICVGNYRHEGFQLRFADYEAIEAPIRGAFATAMTSAAASDRRRAG